MCQYCTGDTDFQILILGKFYPFYFSAFHINQNTINNVAGFPHSEHTIKQITINRKIWERFPCIRNPSTWRQQNSNKYINK